MREKIENFLYFLTIWLCTTVIMLWIIGLIFTNMSEKNKKKQVYKIESKEIFDSLGNVTTIYKIIDHKPTHQDSIDLKFFNN